MSYKVDTDTPEQAKVRLVVNSYKKGFPDEYRAFVAQTKIARDAAMSEYAQMEGSPHRQLHDIPETMFIQLVKVLSVDEMKWFSTKEANRWFAETFPQFALARVI